MTRTASAARTSAQIAALIALWHLPAGALAAPVYQCLKDGITVFSDAPCGANPKVIELPEQRAANAPPPPPPGLRASEIQALSDFAARRTAREAEQRELAKQRAVENEKRARQAELDAIHLRLEEMDRERDAHRRLLYRDPYRFGPPGRRHHHAGPPSQPQWPTPLPRTNAPLPTLQHPPAQPPVYPTQHPRGPSEPGFSE